MDIQNVLLTKASLSGRNGKLLIPKGVLVHYVGNAGSSAMANRNYFNSQGKGVSAHYIVGLQGEILLCVPENEQAGHAGRSYAPQYNKQAQMNNGMYLGIETCHPNADGKFSDITYKALIELLADICKRYNFDPKKDILRHYDVTGKSCPLFYVRNTKAWETLQNDVVIKMNEMSQTRTKMKEGEEVLTEMKLLVDGQEIVIPSIVKDGTNYPNLRALAKAIGYTISYDAEKKIVSLAK